MKRRRVWWRRAQKAPPLSSAEEQLLANIGPAPVSECSSCNELARLLRRTSTTLEGARHLNQRLFANLKAAEDAHKQQREAQERLKKTLETVALLCEDLSRRSTPDTARTVLAIATAARRGRAAVTQGGRYAARRERTADQ